MFREPDFTNEDMLLFMRVFLENNDQIPPIQVISDHFGVCNNAIQCRIARLEKKGILVRNKINKIMFPKNK